MSARTLSRSAFSPISHPRANVRGLLAPRPVDDFELDLLALESPVAVSLNGGEVHEHVLTVRTLEEPIALLVAEPLDGPLC